MAGVWKNAEATREGKFPIVLRRDGSVVDWPHFVLGFRDPCTPAALRAYALAADLRGLDPRYAEDVLALASEAARWREEHGDGDPDAPRHRVDDPGVIEWANMSPRPDLRGYFHVVMERAFRAAEADGMDDGRARPLDEWREDDGPALWWRFPVEEPPYSGTPLDAEWPGYHTHWTVIEVPEPPR